MPTHSTVRHFSLASASCLFFSPLFFGLRQNILYAMHLPCGRKGGREAGEGLPACLAILLPLQMMGSSWTTLEALAAAVAMAWPTFYVGHARVLLQRLLTMLIGRRRFCPDVHFTNSFEYPASGPSHVSIYDVCVCVFSILNTTL